MAMLTVTTVPANDVAAGKLQITASTRATKGKTIADKDRSRSIIIPEFAPQVSDKYVFLVSSALASLAKDQLAAIWKESDPKEVDSALFEEDSLLAFAQREAESTRLTKEVIADWYKSSMLRKFIVAKFGEKVANVKGTQLQNCAPNSKIEESFPTEDATLKAITFIASVEEPEDDTMQDRLIAILQKRVESIRAMHAALSDEAAAPF